MYMVGGNPENEDVHALVAALFYSMSDIVREELIKI